MDALYAAQPRLSQHPNVQPHLALCGQKRRSAMIKKVAGGYQVLSEKGKNLGGPYKTKKQAEKRLRQVEFFKHRKGG